jgi:hypothetical protein
MLRQVHNPIKGHVQSRIGAGLRKLGLMVAAGRNILSADFAAMPGEASPTLDVWTYVRREQLRLSLTFDRFAWHAQFPEVFRAVAWLLRG